MVRNLGRRPLRVVDAAAVLRHAAQLRDAAVHATPRRGVLLHSYSDGAARRAILGLQSLEGWQSRIDILDPHDPRIEAAQEPHAARILDERWKVTLARVLDAETDLILLPFATPGVRWEAIFWLSVLPMRRVLIAVPAVTLQEWSSRVAGVLDAQSAGPTSPRRSNPVTTVFGTDEYEVAVRGYLQAECLPLLVGLQSLHRLGASMPAALRGRVSFIPWRALTAVDPWEVQRRLLNQLWSERAVLKHHWHYDKGQWLRIAEALESATRGQPVDDADALAALLHDQAVRLYAVAERDLPSDQRSDVTRSAEEWRLFAHLLRTKDEAGHQCVGPRPPGDVDDQLLLTPIGAVRYVASHVIRILAARVRDRWDAFRMRREWPA